MGRVDQAPSRDPRHRPEPIAVVGIGCRMPGGADSPEAFWQLLMERRDAIGDVPAERWNHDAFHHPEPGMPRKTVAAQAGFVDDIDRFDPAFFGISPREAAQMDPQHRLLLEVGWEALEDAGIPQEVAAAAVTGVFMGISAREYPLLQTTDTVGTHTTTGQAATMAANRLSYAFDLKGPSIALDTACSSSLVAVHMACRSMWDGESEMALAGGVNLNLSPDAFVGFSSLSMLSPDSRCFAFDERANGYVRSEGAGVLVLKPLARAVADGDRIYARILATAVNQDGHTQGITVPGLPAQERMLRDAYSRAGVAPGDVAYVEAHGTGTQVGDFVEASAIGSVLGSAEEREAPLLLGSVKTNVGHLESAAGVAGLLKACLITRNGVVPANLNFETPNSRIDFDALRLRVPTEATPLPGGGAGVVGVNSFGFGGTNAHVVLAPPPEPAGPALGAGEGAVRGAAPEGEGRLHLLPLSARSPEALRATAARFRDLLDDLDADDPSALAAVCHTAAVRRTHHSHRLVARGDGSGALRDALQGFLDGEERDDVVTGRSAPAGRTPRVAFVFPGQGSQWRGMGRELLAGEAVFRRVVERCDAVVRSEAGWSLLDEFAADADTSRLQETAVTQPMLFAVQAGLVALLRSWGVTPELVVGHSVGEIAAAHAAGVLELEDAARVAVHRGRLMDRASARGRMLAVGATREQVLPHLEGLEERVSLAAVNSPTSLTLSGEGGALEGVRRALRRDRVASAWLDVEYAFHSPQMEPIRDELLSALEWLEPHGARCRLVSTVTGSASPGTEWDADYWWRNLREPVHFAEAIATAAGEGIDVFVEVGPQPTLVGALRDGLGAVGVEGSILSPLRRTGFDALALAGTVARLHALGAPVSWSVPYPRGPLATLPHYPWQRDRHWIESERRRHEISAGPSHPLLGVEQLGARPVWHARVDLVTHAYLADHALQGAPVFPAAAYLEMALAVSNQVTESPVLELEAVRFEAPCFLNEDGDTVLETRFDPTESRFEIFSRGRADTPWTLHSSGRVVDAAGASAPAPDGGSAAEAEGDERLDPVEIYKAFADVGLEYGPSFRGIVAAWRHPDAGTGLAEATAEVALSGPAADPSAAAGYLIHPALLDTCFQAILANVSWETASEAPSAYLPVGVDRLRLWGDPGRGGRCRVRLIHLTADELRADVYLEDEDGRLVLEVRGLTCRAAARNADASGVDDLLYRSRWVPEPLPDDARTVAEPSTWLVFADDAGFADVLAGLLDERGDRVVAVHPGSGRGPGAPGRVDPEDADALAALLDDATGDPSRPLRRVVWGWGLDGGAGERGGIDGAGDGTFGLGGLLRVVQALANDAHPEPTPRLIVVSRRAQAVDAGEAGEVDPGQAPAWGFRRVAAFEHPGLAPLALDLGAPDDAAEVAALVAEIDADIPEDEVVLRGGVRHVHRYAHTSRGELAPDRRRVVDPAEVAFRAESHRLGVFDNLTLRAFPEPVPGPGEVAIRVQAAGLNFADVLKALGLYPGVTSATATFGAECAGVVTAVGPAPEGRPSRNGSGGLAVGQRVVALAPHTFGSRVVTPDAYVFPVPDGLDFAQAAALPIVFLTAHYGLVELGRLRRGERVLIHSATGGVGQAALQIARARGARVFATAGTDEKRDFLREQGVEHVFDSRSLAFADGVLAATGGEGVDVVLNSLAGEAIRKGLSILRPFGRFIEIGKRDVHGDARLGLRPLKDNITFSVLDLDQAMRVHPALVHDLFAEVMQAFAEGTYGPVPVRSFPVPELVDALRHLSKAQHMGKVVLDMQVPEVEVAFRREMPALRGDGTYLVSGGLGGFGRTVARWLAERGAGALVLLGRRGGETPGAQELVDELEGLGSRVKVAAVDVTDAEAMAALLDDVRASLPPIRGVVHAAMVLDDGVIRRLDPARLERVLAPKAGGAWTLHRLTADDPLDLFVLTSSVSSILGSPGQANYAAANAYLDALAHLRRGQGRPALSVNLGALGSVGHASRHPELLAYLANMGIPPLDPREALAAIEVLLAAGVAQAGVVDFDFQRLAAGITGSLLPARFRDLVARSGSGDVGSEARALRRAVDGADPDERQELILGALVDELGRVLGVETDNFDVQLPLSELGIDSLMTVELVVWVEQSLDLEIPTVELMRNPTTAELAALLVELLAEGEAGARGDGGEDGPDLRGDARLDADLAPASRGEPLDAPQHILLTGATGFVGAHLLAELLVRTEATVHCLVRAADADAGMVRLREALRSHGGWDGEGSGRIVAVPGDLAAPRLGLDEATHAELAGGLDAVIHAGAVVNFLSPYEGLRAANVEGTRSILELVAAGRPKRLHHVSSIAVFGTGHGRGTLSEDTIPHEVDELPDGYSQSKWVAEQLVFAAARQGLDVRVYRPGILGGDTATGAASLSDALLQLFVASCRVGALPDLPVRVDVIPVDVAARAIVEIAGSGRRERIYHLTNPEPTPIAEILPWLGDHGLELEVVPFAEWRGRLEAGTGTHRFGHLLPLVPESADEALARLGGPDRRFDLSHTRRALEGSDLALEPLTRELVAGVLDFLAAEGLVPLREREPRAVGGAASTG